MDPAALETAVSMTEQELAKGADLLIVNKFGKHEADGRGFRTLIAAALEQDVPVLVGANTLNLAALNSFCDDQAEEVPADVDALLAWVMKD